MIRCRTAVLSSILIGVASLPASAQVRDLTALRQAVAQSGGRVIVTLKSTRGPALKTAGAPPLSPDEMNSVQARLETGYPVQVLSQIPFIGALVATMSDADLARLAADPNVDVIEPDVKTYLTAAMSRSVARPARVRADAIPWGVSDVAAPTAWAAGLTGAGVKVGIIDTGVDYTHPDLVVAGGFDFNTYTDVPGAYTDNNSACGGHGTHVAGIVAARQNNQQVIGVAPNVSLYALKVFNTDASVGCFAYLSSQVSAIQWAVTNHLDVVNMSIGNSASTAFDAAIAAANAGGVVVVAAAGNGGGAGIYYPAAAPGAIAVAALDPGNTVAGYSSSGPEMWIAAPGSSVESTMPGGGTGFKSGTSMASPHVAGIVALIRQAHPTWTATQVRDELKHDAIDIAAPGFDNNSGWGLVQAPPTGVIPVSIAVSPAARSTSVQQGNTAPSDNATVTLTGTNAGTTAWSATKRKAWLTLTTASGTGSGTVAWSRNATGLAVGTYVDTITVSAAGATGSPTTVYDTLKITAPVVPVTVAVSPATRSASVQQGNAAPGDNAAVTLSGTNAASTAWSATKKKAWLTLTTASGTGNGTVAWSRNASGLAVGTYVDTVTVTAASSSAVVYDTLKITAAPIPVALAVTPGARSVSVQQGNVAPSDNATVTLTGTNAGTTAWSATKRQAWLTLIAAGGTGSGTVTWSRNATGLTVGTYVDTITVSAAGAIGSPTTVYDTLKITASAVPVTVAVNPVARSTSVQQGNVAPSDNATVTLTGTNAGTTAWSATKRQAWLTLIAASGTGSGTVTWSRNATGLTVGTYVDTITVTAASSSAVVYDTLKITASVVPVTVAVSPAARSTSVQQGNVASSDNATVTLTGTNAGTTAWSATKRQAWLTLIAASGTGSGTVTWSRNATGLGAGTYVDTITVTAASSSAVVYDTLKITAAPVAVALAVNPGGRRASVQQGGAAPGDNVAVTLTGTSSQFTAWWVVKKQPWLTLTSPGGTGSGTLAWTRNAAGLGVGTYIDTITVATAVTAAVTVYDTLTVTAAPIPIALAVSPASRSVAVQQGNPAPSDNAAVTLTGTNANATEWGATKKQAWLTLTSGTGTGSGSLAWSRNASGLAAGTYVDTITVVAAGLSAMVFDTLQITAAPISLVMAVSPRARSISVPQGTVAWSDNAAVTVTGSGAAAAAWSATRSSPWTTLINASGTGDGFVTWGRNTTALAAGTYVDTIVVTLAASGQAIQIFDTVQVTPVAATIALAPRGRRVRSVRFAGSSNMVAQDADSALVEAANPDSVTAAGWNATASSGRVVLATPTGAVNSYVKWSRPVQPLDPGMYVDTIAVMLQSDPTVRAEFIDSLEVVAVSIPVPDAAVGDLFDRRSLNDDQRLALDRQGNNNGRYDLGDFLAWVNRNHIRLSSAQALRLRQLPIVRAGGQ